MRRYLEIDVGRITGTKEEGSYSTFKNNEEGINLTK